MRAMGQVFGLRFLFGFKPLGQYDKGCTMILQCAAREVRDDALCHIELFGTTRCHYEAPMAYARVRVRSQRHTINMRLRRLTRG